MAMLKSFQSHHFWGSHSTVYQFINGVLEINKSIQLAFILLTDMVATNMMDLAACKEAQMIACRQLWATMSADDLRVELVSLDMILQSRENELAIARKLIEELKETPWPQTREPMVEATTMASIELQGTIISIAT